MGFFSTIGNAVGAFCAAVWKGLQAMWSFINKVVSTLLTWAGAILNWLCSVVGMLIVGVIVAFIWIFGDDDDLEDEDGDEKKLGEQIGRKLNDPTRKKIVIKGVFNKETGELLNKTEIESTNTISTEVKQQTGNKRFAELEIE